MSDGDQQPGPRGTEPARRRALRGVSAPDPWLQGDADAFHAELTFRNRGLLSDVEQEGLRRTTILVAGCGGIGGAAIEPLVRAGAEALILADPGVYGLQDANRESARVADIGRQKVSVFAERMREINPHAGIVACPDGVTDDNVIALATQADIIIDGVTATENAPLRAKLTLHREARRLAKPVISGYDLAGTQWTAVYDYRDPTLKLFDGKARDNDIDDPQPLAFLSRLLAPVKVPIEMMAEYERQLLGQSIVAPALGYTSLIFGALAVRVTLDLLMSRPVRPSILVDVPSLVRPRRDQLLANGKRLAMLYAINNRLRGLKRAGRLGVYSPLDDDVFAVMREHMEERVWEAGSVIIRQGDPGHDFFVILEGGVNVEHDDPEGLVEPQVIASLGPGEYFGERALLTDEPRNASVVAATRCRVLSMSRDGFEEFLRGSATAQRRVVEAAQVRDGR